MDAKSQLKQEYQVRFYGSGWQFFKIWIVNILLTMLTCYIYSAWAKVRTKRYFYGNTLLDGSSFEYHAKPMQILVSRLIAFALFVCVTIAGVFSPLIPIIASIILFAIIPWAIWRSTKFNMRMTSYRNVRFGFDGKLWPVYKYQAVIPLCAYALPFVLVGVASYLEAGLAVVGTIVGLSVIINFFVVAYTHQRLVDYFVNGYQYGKSRFAGSTKFGSFVSIYLQAVAFVVVALIAIVAVVALVLGSQGLSLPDFMATLSEGGEDLEEDAATAFLMVMGVGYFLFFMFSYFVFALIQSRVRNLVFSQAALEKRITLKSTTSAMGMWWIMISNFVLLVMTLGLARPFTQVRMARYFANKTQVYSLGALDNFVGEKREETGAFGDELGDAFDMDMDVGF